MRAIAEYLLTIDLTNWKATKFPITEVKNDIMDLSASTEKKFLQQWVCNKEDGLVGKDLYKEYKDYCIDQDLPYAQNSISFCIKIIPYKNILYRTNNGKKGDKYYVNIT